MLHSQQAPGIVQRNLFEKDSERELVSENAAKYAAMVANLVCEVSEHELNNDDDGTMRLRTSKAQSSEAVISHQSLQRIK